MNSVKLDLEISSEEYLKHYRIPGAIVVATSRDGRKVQFPASILQRFVSHSGIRGSFEISFTAEGKFSSIRRLS